MLFRLALLAVFLLPLARSDAAADSAAQYSRTHGGRSLIVWQNGHTILEEYTHGGGVDIEENAYSMTKTICAMAMFAAADQGVINLNSKVSDLIPAWRSKPDKREITLRELLDQTSGLFPGYDAIYSHNVRNKNAAALSQPTFAPHGTAFAYGPVHYESMEAFMDKRFGTGPSGPLTYVKMSVLFPLGISPGGWRLDGEGHPFFSAGLHLTSRDYLKIGKLVLNEGHIMAFFPLFSSKHLDEAKLGTDANPMYGMGFWLNRNAGGESVGERDVEECIDAGLTRDGWAHTALSNRAPADLMALVGSYGQRIYIVPSQKLVIVRTGAGREFHDPEFLGRFFSAGN